MRLHQITKYLELNRYTALVSSNEQYSSLPCTSQTDGRSVSQEIPLILRKLNDCFCVSKALPLDRILNLINQIRVNSNKSPTRCNNFPVYYPDAYLQLNMFRAFSAHNQELNDCSGDLWFTLGIVVIAVLCSWSGRPAGRPDHEHNKRPKHVEL